MLLFVHLPNLDPYPGYMPVRSETVDDHEYEELSEGRQICPERHANIFDGKSHSLALFQFSEYWIVIVRHSVSLCLLTKPFTIR